MLEDPKAPVVIDALTLRGIGSYLYGARLEIKPLTILCGSNGAGKSTWLKALNVLEESLSSKKLPFAFAVTDWERQNIHLTNAFYHLIQEGDQVEDSKETEQFGTPGTIGIELHTTESIRLSVNGRQSDVSGIAREFLIESRCPALCHFRLRIAHPTFWDDNADTPHLRHVIELVIDGKHRILMEGDRDPLQRYEDGYKRPRRARPYTLSCSRSFLSGRDEDADEFSAIATVVDLNTPRVEIHDERVSETAVAEVIDNFEARIRELVSQALQGYFYLGAIRQPNLSLRLETDSQVTAPSTGKARYVGPTGEFAWKLEHQYSTLVMQRILEPRFEAGDINYFVWFALTMFRETRPKMERIFERIPAETRAQLELCDYGSFSERESRLLAEAFNHLLTDTNLYADSAWLEVEYEYDDEGEEVAQTFSISDTDIASLVDRGISSLSDAELTLLNFLLILDAFSWSTGPFSPTRQRCLFGEYLSAWLMNLVEVELVAPDPKKLIMFEGGRLRNPTMYISRKSFPAAESKELARLKHACFGSDGISENQPPRQFSAAVHQVFPIVTQLGLMKMGELIGIENPEVHLHPSLQIRITEMLLHHALSGRRIIIETHSDLVLRRVIRAILEEQIAQSQAQIYFVGLTKAKTVSEAPADPSQSSREGTFRCSSMELIRVDESGQIVNWPPGFLDEDIQESRRLMDIMYGRRDEGDADDAD